MTTHEHADGKAIDPVCGMTVDPATTPHHATHDGTDYHFCSAGCRTKFLADPQRYLHPDQAEPLPPPPPGTRHTCPMPPERSDEHTSELPSLLSLTSAVFCLNKNTQL